MKMKKVKKETSWLNSLSGTSKQTVNKILLIVIKYIELHGGKIAIKIPINEFTEQQLKYTEVTVVLERLSNNRQLFRILNEYYKKVDREVDKAIRMNKPFNHLTAVEYDAYERLGFIQEDLDEFILLEIKDPNTLTTLKSMTSDLTHDISMSFNSKNRMLFIGEKSVKFSGFRGELITLLFKNEKNKKTKWWYAENLFDELQGEISSQLEEKKQFSDKMYSACDGINKRVAVKTGYTDFLYFNTTSLQLNPHILKVS